MHGKLMMCFEATDVLMIGLCLSITGAVVAAMIHEWKKGEEDADG